MNKKKGAGQEDGLGEKALAVKADDLSFNTQIFTW